MSPSHGDLISELVPTSTSWREVWQQAHIRRPCAWYCFQCLLENWYFEFGETYYCGHLCVTSLIFCICSPVWGSAAAYHRHFLSTRCIRWPGFVSNRVSCRCIIDVVWLDLVCCTRLIRTIITVCSVSFHLLLLEFDIPGLRPQLIHCDLKYQGVERPNWLGLPTGSGSNVD